MTSCEAVDLTTRPRPSLPPSDNSRLFFGLRLSEGTKVDEQKKRKENLVDNCISRWLALTRRTLVCESITSGANQKMALTMERPLNRVALLLFSELEETGPMRRARDQSEQGHREGQCRKRSRSHKGHNRGALTCLCYGLLLTCPKRIWMSEGAATRGGGEGDG